MNPLEADILIKIDRKEKQSDIKSYLLDNTNFTSDESEIFIQSVKDLISQQNNLIIVNPHADLGAELILPNKFSHTRYYKIGNTIFLIEYESSELEYHIHPKFAHLEIEHAHLHHAHFQVFSSNNKFVLRVDNKVIGQWDGDNLHYLTGKFSMEILNRMYHRSEADWLGVFHASAIGDQQNALMFTGDSGHGKSTISAILFNKGYQLIADDFVPLNTSATINFLPAALSIKMSAWNTISNLFPSINMAKEFHFEGLNKTVKYLPPDSNLVNNSFSVKAIVLVKYQPEISCELHSISNAEAFQELVPDSWLSPIAENADHFLDWFLKMPCYRLTYSDNEKMLSAIKNLFDE